MFNVTGGYNSADWNGGWEISVTDTAPNTVLNTTIYPPYSPHNPQTNITGNAATATWADTVDVNSSNSGSYYDVVWHSGDTLYSAASSKFRIRPSDGATSQAGVNYASDHDTSSDERIKTDIKRIENASEKRRACHGYTYFKDGKFTAGNIAQQFEAVFDVAVNVQDSDRVPDGKLKSISTSATLGLLLESANEDYDHFTAEIASLNQTINEQDERIAKLEAMVTALMESK